MPGPLRTALSQRPLVGLGRISYGVYLFHWPVFVVLTEARTGLDGVGLVAARLATTLVISLVSYAAIERPVRTRVHVRPVRIGAGALAATCLVAVAVVVVVDPGRGDYWRSTDVAEAAQIETVGGGTLAPLAPAALVTPSTGSSTGSSAPPTAAPTAESIAESAAADPSADGGRPSAPTSDAAPGSSPAPTSTPSSTSTELALPSLSRPMRVLVAGDSTAEATGVGLAQWAVDHPELAQVTLAAAQGCGFLRGGEFDAGEWMPYADVCDSWRADLPVRVRELQPDVVMLMTTSWDVLDRRWDGGPVLTPFDDEYRARLRTDLDDVVAQLLGAGAAHVVFVRGPVPVPLWGFGGEQAQSDVARHDVLGSVMSEVAADHAGRATVVDLNPWLDAAGLAEDHDARPDGVHWTPEVAARIASDELGGALVRAALGR